LPFFIIYVNIQMQMAHNVQGMRRLEQVKDFAQQMSPAPNVAETKPHKGHLPDCGFSQPGGGACRRRSAYRLLNDVRLFKLFFESIIFFLFAFVNLFSRNLWLFLNLGKNEH
jgi:hypothetical protein